MRDEWAKPIAKKLSNRATGDRPQWSEGALSQPSGDERGLRPLIETLNSRDPDLRRTAALALGQIHDPRIVDPLIEALRDPDPEVRRWAVLGLGRFGDPAALPAMVYSLRETGQLEREAAATALTMMGPQAIPIVAEALQFHNSDTACAAAGVLGQIADARSVSPLIRALKAPEMRQRMAAARALGELASHNPVPEARAALAPLRRLAWQEKGDFYRAIIAQIEGATEPTAHLPIPAAPPDPLMAHLPIPSHPSLLDPAGLPIPAHPSPTGQNEVTSQSLAAQARPARLDGSGFFSKILSQIVLRCRAAREERP